MIIAKSGLNSSKRFLCGSCPAATWQNKGPCAKSLKKSTWLSYNLPPYETNPRNNFNHYQADATHDLIWAGNEEETNYI